MLDDDTRALLESWDGNGVLTRFDRPTGTWIFIALHDATLGLPTGGTRLASYPSLADAVRDAQRLAEGMTCKWAGLDLPYGGGKAVMAAPGPLEGEARRGLFLRYGDLLASLGGAFRTGEDLGTTVEDMGTIAERCGYVLGIDDSGAPIDPGPFTARGVFEGLRAAVTQVFDGDGDSDGGKGRGGLEGKRVLVQGLGDVGHPLAEALAEHGAELLVSDLDGERADDVAASLGAETVAPDAVYRTPCDVFAPCAIGGVLSARTVPELRCRIVAGSANNQLENEDDAERLEARGIVYVPDYILNAGGALAFATMADGERDERALMAGVARIGTKVAALLEKARAEAVPPTVAARRQVERRLSAMRAK